MSRFAVPAAVAVCLVLASSMAQGRRSAPPPAAASELDSEGTDAEQDACHPDATRFCKAAIPDTFKVLTCLQNNRAKISKACRAVLRSHGVLEPPAPADNSPAR